MRAHVVHEIRFVPISDEREHFPKVRYSIGVGREFLAQSDALRVRGDAAHPARQESRPARRRAVKIACSVPPPTTGAVVASREAMQAERHRSLVQTSTGSRSTATHMGTTGKGACMGDTQRCT